MSGEQKFSILIKDYKLFLDIVQQVIEYIKIESNIFFNLIYNNIIIYNINHINNYEINNCQLIIDQMILDNINEITFNIIYLTNMIDYLIEYMINDARYYIKFHIDIIHNCLRYKELSLQYKFNSIKTNDIYLSLKFKINDLQKSFILYTYIQEFYRSSPSLNNLYINNKDDIKIIINFNIIKNNINICFIINKQIYPTKQVFTNFNINEFIEIIINCDNCELISLNNKKNKTNRQKLKINNNSKKYLVELLIVEYLESNLQTIESLFLKISITFFSNLDIFINLIPKKVCIKYLVSDE
jgi:hypothetical protein